MGAKIKEILGYDYETPICPAATTGLHINNIGEVVVHKDTGINCGWFYLMEPEMKVLGSIRNTSLSKLHVLVWQYRLTLLKRSSLMKWINKLDRKRKLITFGGCGGKGIGSIYLSYLKKIKNGGEPL